MAFATSYPLLLADGVFHRKSVEDLERFAMLIETINRGLDNAHTAMDIGDSKRLTEETRRLRLKFLHLLESDSKSEAYVLLARRALRNL